MLFVIEGRDRIGHLEIRLEARPKHLEYIKTLGEKIVLAGPFLDENEKPCGSLIIIRANSLEEAKKIAAADPYNEVDLFENVEVRAWLWAVNKPE
jgi:hypothetical protein